MANRVIEEIDIDHLMIVAAQLFAERGFEGIGVREIAAKAGIPATSIYRHFDSKLGLFQEASARHYEETFAMVNHAVEGCANPGDKVTALVNTFFDIFVKDQILFMLLQRDVADSALRNTQSVMRHHYEQYLGLIEKILSELLSSTVNQKNVMTVAALIFGYCELMFITDGAPLTRDAKWLEEHKQHLGRQVQLFCDNLIAARRK